MTQRLWRPPETRGWLLFGTDIRPECPDDIEAIALEEGYEPEEVSVMKRIAAQGEIGNNPFVSVSQDAGFSYEIEVIIPPGEVDMITVYERYNS